MSGRALFWFDYENEGLNIEHHNPLSIGYCITDIYGNKIADTQYHLVNCGTYDCTPEAFNLHGITHSMVLDHGITLDEVRDRIMEYTKDYDRFIPAGQNIMNFDQPLLRRVHSAHPELLKKFDRRFLDLQCLSLFLFPGERLKLSVCLDRFGLDQGKIHNAGHDVDCSIELFRSYRKLLTEDLAIKAELIRDENKIKSPLGDGK